MAPRADVHLTPDDGLKAYTEPYPRFVGGVDQTAGRLSGREIVEVVDVQGTWAQVSVNGAIVGWVDGRKLLPPIGAPVGMAPHGTPAPGRAVAISIDSIVGGFAAIGIIVGAAIDWTRGVAGITSFKVPVAFLFDYKTESRHPDLGWFLIAIAVMALVVSFFVRGGSMRVVLGILALVAASLFCIQIARELEHTSRSFSDVVGKGPWVTGVSAFVLMLSPLFRPLD